MDLSYLIANRLIANRRYSFKLTQRHGEGGDGNRQRQRAQTEM
jgi:hypothetical protein